MKQKDRFLARAAAVANFILIGAGIVCFFALAYFVYHYAWTGQRVFTSWKGGLTYYVFPALLTILFFASLRLSASRKINLACFICSAGVSIYALEIVLTVWFNLPSVMQDQSRKVFAESAKALGVEFDSRSNQQVIEDLRSQGVDAFPSFPRPLLKREQDGTTKSAISINGSEVLPFGGIARKLIVLCNETGRFVTYTSDDHGFNNPQKLWDKVPIDIVAVGDSFVQGYCVDDNFVSVIRRRYPATVNLGMEGDGPLVMLGTIKEYAQILKPKVVLWFYFEGNDIGDLVSERKSSLLRRYLTNGFSQGLFARQTEIDRALDEYIKTERDKIKLLARLEEINEHLDQLPAKAGSIARFGELRQRLGLIQGEVALGHRRRAEPRPASNEEQAEIELLGNILIQAKETVSRWGGKLYFVFLPVYNRYTPEATGGYRDSVLSAAKDVGLPVIDIHKTFMNQKDPLALFPFRLNAHYTEEGHRLVAQEVLRSIASSELQSE